MTLHEFPKVDQGTPEWHTLRRGIVTASVVGKLIAVGSPDASAVECETCKATPGDPCISAARKTPTPIKTFHDARAAKASKLPPVYEVADNDTSRLLTATLVAERIAGWTEDTFTNADMFRGVMCEPVARDLYSDHYDSATEIGFMLLEEDGWSLGYSPDGLVGADGLLEVKAPRAKTHVLAVLHDKVPTYNMAQCQAGLLVSGRKWLDFVPFVGGLPLWKKRVFPDPDWFAAIAAACQRFETTATQMVAAYETATTGLPTTERIIEPEMSLR